MKRGRPATAPFAVFLFLIWGAVAVWLHATFTDARLSPDPARWGVPFLIGGAAGVGVFALFSGLGAMRRLIGGRRDRR